MGGPGVSLCGVMSERMYVRTYIVQSCTSPGTEREVGSGRPTKRNYKTVAPLSPVVFLSSWCVRKNTHAANWTNLITENAPNRTGQPQETAADFPRRLCRTRLERTDIFMQPANCISRGYSRGLTRARSPFWCVCVGISLYDTTDL